MPHDTRASATPSTRVASAAPQQRRDGTRLALIALFAGAFTIGFSGIFVRWSETGPVATGFYRFGISAVVLLLLPLLVPATRTQIVARVSRRDRLWLLAGGILFAADIVSWHPALLMTTVSNATFIGNISTIFVAIGAWLFLR